MQNLGVYHDLYPTTDVAFLGDVFENFREICMREHGLEPAHYYTSPGVSWDALLKKTGMELELLTDMNMHNFIESGMRGGISMVSKRYAKANNPLVEGYDPSKSCTHITYYYATNPCGWAMSKPLPTRDFKWKRIMPTEEQILKKKKGPRGVRYSMWTWSSPQSCTQSATVYLWPRRKRPWKRSGCRTTRRV